MRHGHAESSRDAHLGRRLAAAGSGASRGGPKALAATASGNGLARSSAGEGGSHSSVTRASTAMSPNTAAHFNSLSESLQEAAIALRRIVPLQGSSGLRAGRKSQQPKVVPPPPRLLLHPPPPGDSWSPDRGHGRDAVAFRMLGAEEPWASAPSDVQANSELSPSIPSVLLCSSLSPTHGSRGPEVVSSVVANVDGKEVAGVAGGGHADIGLAPTIQRLMHENTALREALEDANGRLSRLEDEKLRFFDEGIFDLVNSVCGQAGDGARGGDDDVVAQLKTWDLLASPKEANALSLSQSRRYEEEKRSAELSGENEELRRELAYAREVGDALEQQQQAAEDRMHSLEQEQMWLNSRLVHLGEGADAGTGSASVAAEDPGFSFPQRLKDVAPCIDNSPKLDEHGDARHLRELEEANCALRTELQDASRLHADLLAGGAAASASPSAGNPIVAASNLGRSEEDLAAYKAELASQQETQRREAEAQRWEAELREQQRLEEFKQERDQQASIISSLDDQTQALERQLRETEARALSLAEENARLQAALSSVPEGCSELADGAETETAPEVDVQADVPQAASAIAAATAPPKTEDAVVEHLDKIELEEAW